MNLMEARFEFSMRVCYKVKVDIHTLSDTVDRENFAAKNNFAVETNCENLTREK